MSALDDIPSGDIWVVYDGECPFCSSYVLLYRLRALAGQVHLIDARSDHPLVEAIRHQGFDLDEGMAVAFGGRIYWGAEAMNVLALLGGDGTIFNRLNRLLFHRIGLARLLYPILVRGRMLTLRLLGRQRIGKA